MKFPIFRALSCPNYSICCQTVVPPTKSTVQQMICLDTYSSCISSHDAMNAGFGNKLNANFKLIQCENNNEIVWSLKSSTENEEVENEHFK